MLGLDAAGKTTILYKLHIGEVLSTVPTLGEWIRGDPREISPPRRPLGEKKLKNEIVEPDPARPALTPRPSPPSPLPLPRFQRGEGAV
jgi:hypothetical protein